MPCFFTDGPEETMALAKHFAACLSGGELLAFTGGMGAGKTTFCRGLAQGLGVLDEVSSPTYAIAQLYRGNPALAHFDAWRLENEDDLEAAGFYDYLQQGAVVAVEWSEKLQEIHDMTHISIDMRILANAQRQIRIEGAPAFEHNSRL